METTAAFASKLTAGSIPRKSRNPRKFSFPSQTKYSPPIITFVHCVNPYLHFFFSNESEKRPSTDSADSWWRANPWNQRKFLNLKDFSFFFIRNVQSLAIENKYLHGLSPAILNEVFKVNETISYDLRMRNELCARNPKTVRYGTETVSFSSSKIWSLIPQNVKDSGSLPCFKKNY